MYNTIISVAELKQQLAAEPVTLVVFDCRFNLAEPAAGAAAYAAGHIPGAFYLHLDDDLSSPITATTGRHPLPDATTLAAKLGAAGVTPTTQVVVYDDCGGAMAARAWWLLRWLGHDAVAVLDGGYPAWVQGGGDQSADAATSSADTAYAAQQQTQMVLALPALEHELAAQAICLVDARSAERFRGEVEPIDPVAGHVPGAVNRPLTDNLQDGLFKPAALLHSEWSAFLAQYQASPDQVVHMCGSGVTACHNLLAMEIAGLSGSRVYPGSWSEWIRDPARAIATQGASD